MVASGFTGGAFAADKYQLAARITVSIAKFSQWQNGGDDGSSITIGVYSGSDATAAFKTLEGERLKNRSIRVVNVSSESDLANCNIVSRRHALS